MTLVAEQALAAQRCASCPKMCRGVCPTLEVTRNERHQPWGHSRSVVGAMRTGAPGFASPEVVDAAFTCATCGACTVPCEVEGVETPELSWAVRTAVHAAGATPPIGLQAVAEAAAGRVLERDDPPRWGDPGPSLAALRELETPGAPLLLFPGCGVLGRRPAAAIAAGRVLRHLGVAFQVAAEHRCCGAVALAFGDQAAIDRGIDATRAGVTSAGVERMAVQSPSCAHLLGVIAPGRALPLGIPVEPLAATLARALENTAPPPPERASAYHDPCFLSRHQRCREEPRAALRGTGTAIVELERRGDATRCSGRGGGLALTHPNVAGGYLRLLADEVAEAGADRLVTGCASCAAALDGAVAGVAVVELAEALAEDLGLQRGGRP
jgi:heterodisulfide reductase subunit D